MCVPFASVVYRVPDRDWVATIGKVDADLLREACAEVDEQRGEETKVRSIAVLFALCQSFLCLRCRGNRVKPWHQAMAKAGLRSRARARQAVGLGTCVCACVGICIVRLLRVGERRRVATGRVVRKKELGRRLAVSHQEVKTRPLTSRGEGYQTRLLTHVVVSQRVARCRYRVLGQRSVGRPLR